MTNWLKSRHGGRFPSRWIWLAASVIPFALLLAACGGGDSTNSGGSTTSAGSTISESKEESGASTPSSEEVAAAKKVIAPFNGHPSPFPVTEPLKELPPKGTVIAYPDCGSPVCALMGEILEGAAKTMGVTIKRVKAGPDAKTAQTGMETIIAMKPAAMISAIGSLELVGHQIEELKEEGTVIVTTGSSGSENEKYGIKSSVSSTPQNLRAGELMANYVIAEMSPEANIVIYETKELPFSLEIGQKITEEIESKCAGCSVRSSDITIAEVGTRAPSTVVSDLQANPDTTVAVFTTNEITTGLPAALKSAGIEVETLGYAPGPGELQDLKEGKQTAGLAFDIGVSVWSLLDMTARELAGQPDSGPQSEGYAVNQFLTEKDITFDPSKGWTGYPNFPEMFAKLWGVEG